MGLGQGWRVSAAAETPHAHAMPLAAAHTHVCDAAHIPAVERLIKAFCAGKDVLRGKGGAQVRGGGDTRAGWAVRAGGRQCD